MGAEITYADSDATSSVHCQVTCCHRTPLHTWQRPRTTKSPLAMSQPRPVLIRVRSESLQYVHGQQLTVSVFEDCAWRPRTLLCLQQRFPPLDLAIVLRNAFFERQLTRPERAAREPGTTGRLYAPSRMICYTFEVGRLGVRWQASLRRGR
jgi:hypothetical protein